MYWRLPVPRNARTRSPAGACLHRAGLQAARALLELAQVGLQLVDVLALRHAGGADAQRFLARRG